MPGVAVIGNVSRDIIAGGEPRVGGTVYHAARALRLLGARGRVVTRSSATDRRALVSRLVALGLPVAWSAGTRTAAFSFRYDGDRRLMSIDELGDPWTPADARGWAGRAIGRSGWVLVGALARSDFPAATLAELARGRRLLLDGQGLARPARTGQVALDDDFDPALLGSLTMLKLAEDEAVALAGSAEPGAIRRLGVPEVVVTLGSRGAVVVTRRGAEQIQVRPVEGRVDPTGAGDAFAAVYLASRAAGHAPSSAGRRASALVTGLLQGRTR